MSMACFHVFIADCEAFSRFAQPDQKRKTDSWKPSAFKNSSIRRWLLLRYRSVPVLNCAKVEVGARYRFLRARFVRARIQFALTPGSVNRRIDQQLEQE